MRNPLDRPQTLTEAGGPGSSRVHSMKSLVADNPSTLTFTTTHRESPCGRQPLDIHGPAPRKALRQTVPRAFANPRSNAGRIAQRNTPMQKPADPKGRLGQTRASPTASTGCAVFAKAGFLCDNKRHPFRGINGRLAQRERRCLTSTRSQVQILYRPPLKPQVRRFSSDLFFFSGQPGAYKTKACLN